MGSSSVEQWRKLLHQCLIHRIDANEFRDLAKLLFRRCPLPESTLLDVVLEEARTVTNNVQWDPLLPLYVDALGKLGKVKISTVLQVLLRHSSVVESSSGTSSKPQTPTAAAAAAELPEKEKEREKEKGKEKTRKGKKVCTFMTDIRIIQDAVMAISAGNAPKTTGEAVQIFTAIAEWIMAVVAWHNNNMDEDRQGGGLMNSPDAVSLFESLGILLAALSGTEKALEALSAENSEGTFCASSFPLSFSLSD